MGIKLNMGLLIFTISRKQSKHTKKQNPNFVTSSLFPSAISYAPSSSSSSNFFFFSSGCAALLLPPAGRLDALSLCSPLAAALPVSLLRCQHHSTTLSLSSGDFASGTAGMFNIVFYLLLQLCWYT